MAHDTNRILNNSYKVRITRASPDVGTSMEGGAVGHDK